MLRSGLEFKSDIKMQAEDRGTFEIVFEDEGDNEQEKVSQSQSTHTTSS